MAEINKPSEIKTLLDSETVESFFQQIDAGFKDATERYRKLLSDTAKEYAKQQKDLQEELVKKIADTQVKLEKSGIKNTAEYRKFLMEENAKLEKKKNLELQNAIYKEKIELDTRAGKLKHKQELINALEINEATIRNYEELMSKGIKLTVEQQADLEDKKAEVREGKAKKARDDFFKAAIQQLNVINGNIDKYVQYQTGFNARMQGTGALTSLETSRFGGNVFSALENRLSNAVGIQPYVRTEAMLSNLSELVSQGIAANVEQRAFLETVKDNIATTFDVANASLLRIVRLQQSDSTAARLGMEAYLTRFLNSMVENTEYLNSTFDTVSDALIEASSQMTMKASTEFEFVVQKWLGSLTGTGLSEATSQSIAQAIGYLGSGNISALNASSMQNLLVMAASRAGLDYSSMLTGGLTAQSTNQLMRAIAEYMVELGSNQNNVVRSQLAQTFGLSISDLTAAKQLSGDFGKIAGSNLSFSGMYGELGSQFGQMAGRMSTAQMVQNVFDNALFALSTNVASSPALAALWKVTDLIQSTTGGINIPTIGVLGSFADMNATVEQLMKLGIVGIGSLGMIGDVISGIGSTFAPSSMLTKLGISQSNVGIRRGGGLSSLTSGMTQSSSALVGNASGSDIAESVLSAERGNVQQQVDEETAKQSEKDPTNAIKEYMINTFQQKFDDLTDDIRDIKDKLNVMGF